jgi:two-component system, chemotaxis family, protein-glutamate methylesterase/glutaminase
VSKIRVMHVDDSALMRRVIATLLSRDSSIEMVGAYANAKFALTMIHKLQPDLIILDVEMPEMDGLTALVEIRKKYPVLPVIMCSSLTKQGAETTIDALFRGANDYVAKPSQGGLRDEIFQEMSQELISKIKTLAKSNVALTLSKSPPVVPKPYIKPFSLMERVDILVIGVSTGGPNALVSLLPKIASDFPVPILIVQHMPPIFTNLLAESLSAKCKIKIKEAEDGDFLLPGQALIAPGNYHMTIEYHKNRHMIKLNQDPPENYGRPAADVLFRSVAKQWTSNVLAVVMTGMGQDGLLGCQIIKDNGGHVIVQDELTSVVWGMPGAVVKAGLADQIVPLNELAGIITQRVLRKRV